MIATQRFVYKIHSTRLRKAKWNLKLSLTEARRNEEIIALADSQVLRWIDELNGITDIESKIKDIRRDIKNLRKESTSKENKKAIKCKYLELDELQFRPDYLCLIMDNKSDYKRANNGFKVNGIKYKRYLGTSGGIKNETIIYLNEKIHNEIYNRTNNGRDMNKELVPAKLEAYKALACSASIPVSTPSGVLVVDDFETQFTEDVIELDDTKDANPVMTHVKNKEIKLNGSDGFGLISIEQSERWAKELKLDYIPSGFCIRNSFCKGMLFTFDFKDFAKKIANEKYVKDVWNKHTDKEIDIETINVIMTTSMLKLWDSYTSIEHYLKCCEENHYTFSITKITPKNLDNERALNYQFIQSYNLTDKQIDELIKPTINEIEDVLGLDYRKSILFLKGVNINEQSVFNSNNDFIKALTIDKKMINDPFVRSKIHQMIKKKINDAKIGVLNCKGNFQIISGDPYGLCQSIFGLEVTGLLKPHEFYSKYWIDKGINKVVSFRAPMTSHNNIRLLNFKNTEEMQYWYKFMDTVIILNSWDTTTHALNGADYDSDNFFTSDNKILINNVKELPAVMCVQRKAQKKIVDENDIILSNINGFGDDIGSITNKITSMFEKQALFDKDSKEYKELEYRIICGQLFQQNAIDKIKGIVAKPMNNEWYYRGACKIKESDNDEVKSLKQFNKSILADKKPYFMRYIYPQTMNEYNTYVDKVNKKCILEFRMSIDELLTKNNKTNEQKIFLDNYYRFMPVGISDCLMNKICRKFEDKFDGYLKSVKNDVEFNYSILKSNTKYSENTYGLIKGIYNEYVKKTQEFARSIKGDRNNKEEAIINRIMLKEKYIRKCAEICPNEDELCNIVLDICYTNNNSKQFAWDICGKVFIKNLLEHNDNIFTFPIQDDEGGIEFGGYNFNMIELECDIF